MGSKCIYENCTKSVIWGFLGKRAIYCGDHKLVGTSDLVHKICEIENCTKQVTHGFPGKKKIYCSSHKLTGMSGSSKKCLFSECTIQPGFGFPGEKALYCKSHSLSGMEDVSTKKCFCGKRAIYGPPGGSRSFCGEHKKDMDNLLYKRCKFETGCTDKAGYGLVGESPLYCYKHKTGKMTNLVSKRCLLETCDIISPKFGFPGKKPLYCSQHKLAGMSNICHTKCLNENCTNSPKFGLLGEKPIYCSLHKSEKMINVVHKRCTSCGIFQVDKKRNYLCSYCSPTHRQTSREDTVKELLHKNGYTFIHDKQIVNDSCVRNRPDFLFDCGTYFVILECDEDAHKNYEKECEFVRMNNISYVLNKPTLFIRYNPDLKEVTRKQKHLVLLKTLENCLYKECVPQIEPIYLFYEN